MVFFEISIHLTYGMAFEGRNAKLWRLNIFYCHTSSFFVNRVLKGKLDAH